MCYVCAFVTIFEYLRRHTAKQTRQRHLAKFFRESFQKLRNRQRKRDRGDVIVLWIIQVTIKRGHHAVSDREQNLKIDEGTQ